MPDAAVGTDADLLEIVQLILGQNPRDIDPEDVAERVRSAADELLDYLRAIKTSPTMAGELDRLGQIATAARKLRVALAGVNDFSRELINGDLKHQVKPLLARRRFMERAKISLTVIERECTPNPAAIISMEVLN